MRCAFKTFTNGAGIGSTATDASVFTGSKAQLTVYTMQCLPDRQPAPVQIDVGPSEPERFAAPQPHRQRHRPQRVQPMLFGSFEEAKRFSAGEAANPAIIGHPQLHQPRDVSAE